MGCCSSRNVEFTAQESEIVRVEESIFSGKDAKDIHANFFRSHANFEMSDGQLRAVLTHSNLPTTILDDPNDPIHAFFEKFKKGTKYSVTRLGCLAILLGKGNLKTKSKLYFENYDLDREGTLQEDEVKQMVYDIVLICLDILPEYAYSMADEESKEDLEKYRKELISLKTSFFNYFLNVLMGLASKKPLRYKSFEVKMQHTDARFFLNSHDFRTYCIQEKKIIDELANKKNLKLV
jgi:hypothetical protein